MTCLLLISICWRRIVGDQRLGEWKMAKGGMRTTARGGML